MLNLDPKSLHKFSSHHRPLLEKADKCGCFYCLNIFAPKEIQQWVDNDQTAICPYCSIDSVLPETEEIKITKELLEAMKSRWF